MKAWSPNNANVDAIQAPNVPHVVGDQANATLLNDLNHTRDRAAAIDAFAAARNDAARLATAPQVAAQPLPAAQTAAPPAPPADARPITKANAPGRRAGLLHSLATRTVPRAWRLRLGDDDRLRHQLDGHGALQLRAHARRPPVCERAGAHHGYGPALTS